MFKRSRILANFDKWSPIVTDNDKITRSVLTVKTHAKVDVIFSINKVFKND